MKREIKFRAWSIDDKKFVDGWSMGIDGSHWQYADQGYMCNNIDTDDAHKEQLRAQNIEIRDEFVLMQFTGLKDKNGTEIYEGDIIKKDSGVWGVIVWKAPSYEVTVSATQSSLYTKEFIEDSKVIGNIYEHPELLNN